MTKASTPAIEKFLQPYLSADEFGNYITDENAHKALDAVFAEFENIYCGIEVVKIGPKVFIVRSSKTRKIFCKIRIKEK